MSNELIQNINQPNTFVQPIEPGRPELQGSRCRTCGRVVFPSTPFCKTCFSMGDMEDFPLSREGVLYCYTVAYAAPEGLSTPYAFGRVVLPEGLRLFSILQGCRPYESVLTIGLPVELAIGAVGRGEDGTPKTGYVFKPSQREG
jgi:uncharacterized OB-fold protein